MQGYVLCENVCVCCVHMFNNIRAVALYVPVQQIQVWLDLDTLQWISRVWCDAGNTEREQDCGCYLCAFKSHNCTYVCEFNLITVIKGFLSQPVYVNEIPG